MATATSTAASASPLTSLAVPIQALATSSWTASVSKESTLGQEKNSIDEFLGYCLATSATMESRHDRAHSVAADVEAPPPYMEEDADLPKYSQVDEPVTLAMYLFHFGFFFPPFWILGAYILLSPLRAPQVTKGSSAWMPGKTETERNRIISRMRDVEVKWAKKCLLAMLFFLALLAVGFAVGWSFLMRKQ